MSRTATHAIAAFLLGAASVLGFAPFLLFPLPIVALAVLVRLWRDVPPRQAALTGFAYGCGCFLAGVSWVYVSMHVFGGMPPPLAALAAGLFCGYLALYPALAGYLFARLRRHRLWADALLAAAAWTLADWLRGWLLTGFPWLAYGYAQTPPSPLAGYAPLLGVYGVGFAAALIAALAGLTFHRRRQWLPAGIAIALVLAAGAGLSAIRWTQPTGKPLSVSLLQGNIEQSLKWRPERLQQSLDTYLRLAQGHPAQLVVLPETALPLMLDQLPGDYAAALRRGALGGQGAVLFGIAAQDAQGRYYNSAVGLSPEGLQTYSKRHLVPFGEFTPPAFAWTLALLQLPMSNFSPGPAVQPPLALGGEKVAVNICYEDLFGEEIARALPEATLLVNLSNTAWFGDSLAQPQHLQIAQMRALETGRAMLRATNTGMTAIVGPQGRIERVLPPFGEGVLSAEVSGYSGATPYVGWGNAAVLLLVAAGLLAPLAGLRRGAH
ncbi:MAG: apolipoprotein N-acyltransferase [Burkholderiales bacterium]|nr:apolipoprotein N-acyltransferase [Zoogloeaceae bacterium]MBP9654455.1 apolipoprotein N-acyltransferase [Rhodocyclaceae bacterium]MCZ2175756.1 apolipoprotein N-acyltransferase [Burkholderiales bacterium]MBV6411917.1 Apolipoprotein N-acyltransferase [Rhodocyclaceae bacterium]MCC7270086.1 apolipoprotein N-acyltransferase [Rhodocyclaceae bacterium]